MRLAIDPYLLSFISLMQNKQTIETTSFDGKPFLTPSEFGMLSQQCVSPNPVQVSTPDVLIVTPEAKINDESACHKCNTCQKCGGKKSTLNPKKSSKISCLDVDGIEIIEKRTKTDHSNLHSPIICESTNELNICHATSPTIVSIQKTEQATNKQKNLVNSKKSDKKTKIGQSLNENKGRKKIIQMAFDSTLQKLIFQIECEVGNLEKNFLYLTREEIIEQDPELLLNFYEDHIQFAQIGDLGSEGLKRLDEFA